MGDLITLIILVGSAGGLGVLVLRKIPLLSNLPSKEERPGILKTLFYKWRARALRTGRVKDLSSDALLQKLLLKTRLFALKLENTSSSWLEKVRQRSKEKNAQFSDNYWDQFKKEKRKHQTTRKPT